MKKEKICKNAENSFINATYCNNCCYNIFPDKVFIKFKRKNEEVDKNTIKQAL